MILVDSNVFVMDLRYQRDPLFPVNRAFLDALALDGSGGTTLFNLLEVAGILSFNLNDRQVRELLVHFPRRYRVAVVPAFDRETMLPTMAVHEVLPHILGRMAFGDALVLAAAERFSQPGSTFVTWDASNFVGKTRLTVVTPQEWLVG